MAKKTKPTPIAFRIKKINELRALAKNQERSMNFMVNKAIEFYLEEKAKEKKAA